MNEWRHLLVERVREPRPPHVRRCEDFDDQLEHTPCMAHVNGCERNGSAKRHNTHHDGVLHGTGGNGTVAECAEHSMVRCKQDLKQRRKREVRVGLQSRVY
jgi:hypothetical protein